MPMSWYWMVLMVWPVSVMRRVGDEGDFVADGDGGFLVVAGEDVGPGQDVELVDLAARAWRVAVTLLLDDGDGEPAVGGEGGGVARGSGSTVVPLPLGRVLRTEKSAPRSSLRSWVTSAMSTLMSTCGDGAVELADDLADLILVLAGGGDQQGIGVGVGDDEDLSGEFADEPAVGAAEAGGAAAVPVVEEEELPGREPRPVPPPLVPPKPPLLPPKPPLPPPPPPNPPLRRRSRCFRRRRIRNSSRY